MSGTSPSRVTRSKPNPYPRGAPYRLSSGVWVMQSVHKWLMSAAIVFVVVPFILAFSVSANG